MNLDAEIAAARARLHRSIGQRARWAMVAIRERADYERASTNLALYRYYGIPGWGIKGWAK